MQIDNERSEAVETVYRTVHCKVFGSDANVFLLELGAHVHLTGLTKVHLEILLQYKK